MLRRILTGFGYIFIAIFVVGFTVGLVAYGNDYTYDFKTKRVVQRGHIIIESVPGGVRVEADGKQLNKKTPYQSAYSTGTHTLGLVREGYRAWRKTVEVVAGQVTLVNYVLLIPTNLVRTVVDTKPQIVAQSISKDHRHVAYVSGGANPAVYTVDMGNGKPVRLYTPKPATAEAPAEVITQVAWSNDASHLILESTIGAGKVYRLATASGGEPVNLTETYKFDFTGLAFSANNWKQLYWQSSDGLRRLDVDSQTVSAVLAENVVQFMVAEDHILYVQQTTLGRSLWSLDDRNRRQELIQALPDSAAYSIATANYLGKDMLAVVPSDTKTGTVYSDIYSDTPTAKVVAHNVTTASFSPNGHFATFSAPDAMVTYDLERSQINKQDVIYTAAAMPGNLSVLTWFDDYHVLMVRDDKVYISEYDGGNTTELGAAVPTLPAYHSPDYKSVLVFTPAGDATRFTAVAIRK